MDFGMGGFWKKKKNCYLVVVHNINRLLEGPIEDWKILWWWRRCQAVPASSIGMIQREALCADANFARTHWREGLEVGWKVHSSVSPRRYATPSRRGWMSTWHGTDLMHGRIVYSERDRRWAICTWHDNSGAATIGILLWLLWTVARENIRVEFNICESEGEKRV